MPFELTSEEHDRRISWAEDIEQYVHAVRVFDTKEVTKTSKYLANAMELWWSTSVKGTIRGKRHLLDEYGRN